MRMDISGALVHCVAVCQTKAIHGFLCTVLYRRAEELARRLDEVERSAASERAAAAAAQQSVSRLDSELRVVRGSAAALEAEAAALRQELQVRTRCFGRLGRYRLGSAYPSTFLVVPM